MPHIVLEGPVCLKSFFGHYRPSAESTDRGVLKLQEIFINQAATSVLIEALAVEGGPPNRFFVSIGTKEAKTTVRIYPGSDPEKTPGVKHILALVARQLKDHTPGAAYGSTNLSDYLL